MIELIPLSAIGTELTKSLDIPEELINLQNNRFPWTSYVAHSESAYVGVCAFKYPPDFARATEIAYMVFPEFEGRGLGSLIAKQLLKTAAASGEVVTVLAHTLPHKNASSAICEKAGFQFVGECEDPEDGKVWQWVCRL